MGNGEKPISRISLDRLYQVNVMDSGQLALLVKFFFKLNMLRRLDYPSNMTPRKIVLTKSLRSWR